MTSEGPFQPKPFYDSKYKKEVIRSSQHGSRKGKSFLTNLVAFYDKTTSLLHEGRAVDVVYLEFRKVFDAVCQNIFTRKLTKYRLGKRTVSWTEILLNCWAERIVISHTKSI